MKTAATGTFFKNIPHINFEGIGKILLLTCVLVTTAAFLSPKKRIRVWLIGDSTV